MRIEYVTDIEVFRPLGELWMLEHNGDDLHFDITVDDVMNDAYKVIEAGGVCIGAHDGNEWVGFMLVFMTQSFLGDQIIAIEKYWYAKPNAANAAPYMLREAKEWAKANKCAYLIMSASNLASDKYPKVCEFYERSGMKLFESSYICEVS